MFQQMLGGKTAQMLRLRLDPTMPCVPEISANKYVLNIRFLAQNGDDPTAAHRRLGRRLRAHVLQSLTVKARKVPCPRCGTETVYSPENKWRPFCSERCRMIDLGKWAAEEYRLPDDKTTLAPSPPNHSHAVRAGAPRVLHVGTRQAADRIDRNAWRPRASSRNLSQPNAGGLAPYRSEHREVELERHRALELLAGVAGRRGQRALRSFLQQAQVRRGEVNPVRAGKGGLHQHLAAVVDAQA